MIPLTALLTVGTKLIDKFFPDAQAAEAAKLKLLEMQRRQKKLSNLPPLVRSGW